MPHARPSARRTLTRSIAAASLIAAVGMMHACGQDEAQAAVRTANIQFEAIAAGDVNFRMDDVLAEYQDIESGVSEHAGAGTGYAEAAAVSLAQSKLGQAAHAAQESARAHSDAIRRVRVIRATLSEYLTLSAIAQAASLYNPDEDLAELRDITQLRQADADRYQAQKNEIDNQIADLEAKIAALRARAIAERHQAGNIKLSMTDVSAQRAAELAADAREFTLRADQYDLEADRISGRVGQLRPTAAEIALNAENAASQITMLQRSMDEATERARSSQQDASEARAAAAGARDRLANLANEFRNFHAETVETLGDKVTRLLRAAESDLSPARESLKVSAAATKASIKEALGSAHSRSATGHADAAAIYQSLADAGVPGDFARLAQESRAAMDESLTASGEAFAAAAAALRSIRVSGDARDRLEQAALRLDRLGGNEPDAEFSQDAEFDDLERMQDMGDEGTEPGTEPGDEPTPEDDG
jgi:DNA-binding transcriptional MerR regulator